METLKQKSATTPRVDVCVVAGNGVDSVDTENTLHLEFNRMDSYCDQGNEPRVVISESTKNEKCGWCDVQVLVLHGSAIRSVLSRRHIHLSRHLPMHGW